MIKNSQKRERRLHRKLNDSTHLADWKEPETSYHYAKDYGQVADFKVIKLTWWQKILQWLRKLKPLA